MWKRTTLKPTAVVWGNLSCSAWGFKGRNGLCCGEVQSSSAGLWYTWQVWLTCNKTWKLQTSSQAHFSSMCDWVKKNDFKRARILLHNQTNLVGFSSVYYLELSVTAGRCRKFNEIKVVETFSNQRHGQVGAPAVGGCIDNTWKRGSDEQERWGSSYASSVSVWVSGWRGSPEVGALHPTFKPGCTNDV